LLETKDLFINQSALTGEAMPAEKFGHLCEDARANPFDLPNMCFMGANVVSGYATGVVLRTGARTFFGQLADRIAGRLVPTAFDKGIGRFTWLMMRFIIVMVGDEEDHQDRRRGRHQIVQPPGQPGGFTVAAVRRAGYGSPWFWIARPILMRCRDL
jgi:hypothetical protein